MRADNRPALVVVAFHVVVVVDARKKSSVAGPWLDIHDAILNLQIRLMLKENAVVDFCFVGGQVVEVDDTEDASVNIKGGCTVG